MKKFVVTLLSLAMVCSLAACGNTEKNGKSVPEGETLTAVEAGVNVTDIGTPEKIVEDKETGEVLNTWVPAAGRVGAYVDIFEGRDDDNSRAIVEAANAAEGYNAYILLGTKTEKDAMSYAFLAAPVTNTHATSASEDIIIVVKVFNDGSITVTEFEGTRDDIVDPGETASTTSAAENKIEKTEDVETNDSTEE